MNHSNDKDLKWFYDNKIERFVFEARKDIEANTEVHNGERHARWCNSTLSFFFIYLL